MVRLFVVAVVAAIAVACTPATAPVSPAAPALPAPAVGVRPDTGGSLIYTCLFTANKCLWYRHGVNAVAGTITGLSLPSGIGVDAGGDVYIANFGGQDVPVYAKGSTTPLRTLDDTGHLPLDVKVGADGTVYVANNIDANSSNGSVSVYFPGSTRVSRVLTDPNFGSPTGIAVDEHRELVVCYNNSNGGFCDEFDKTHRHGVTVVSNAGSPGMEGVTFDAAGNLAVQNVLAGTQYFSPSFTPCGTDPANAEEQYVAFDASSGDIYKSDTNGYVEENAYAPCAGASRERRYNAGLGGAVPYGVAVDPGPRL